MKEVIVKKSNILFRNIAAFCRHIFIEFFSLFTAVWKKEKDWCIINNISYSFYFYVMFYSLLFYYIGCSNIILNTKLSLIKTEKCVRNTAKSVHSLYSLHSGWKNKFTQRFWRDSPKLWGTPTIQRGDREEKFHLLIKKLKPYHVQFQTYCRMWVRQFDSRKNRKIESI